MTLNNPGRKGNTSSGRERKGGRNKPFNQIRKKGNLQYQKTEKQFNFKDTNIVLSLRSKPLLIVHGDQQEKKHELLEEAEPFPHVKLFQVNIKLIKSYSDEIPNTLSLKVSL